MLLPILVGLGAALVLLLAGYVFGAKRGHRVRKELRQIIIDLALQLTNRPAGAEAPALAHGSW